jgi:hypothetical protein
MRDPEPVDDGQTYSAEVETRGGSRPEDYMPVAHEDAELEDGAESYPRDAEEAFLDDPEEAE